MRVPYQVMFETFCHILVKKGYPMQKAELSAKLFTDASCDGSRGKLHWNLVDQHHAQHASMGWKRRKTWK